MKFIFWAALTGAVSSLSCQAANAIPAPSATLSLEATGASDCNVRWNGQHVGQDQLLAQSVRLIESRVRQAGGPQAMTEDNIPLLRIEAPPEAPWSCLAPTLNTLGRAGFASVALRPNQVPAAADEIAHFPLLLGDDSDSPPSAILIFGPDRGMTWNGEAIGPGELRTRVAGLGRERSLPGHHVPANQFVVVPEAGTRLAALVTLIHDAAGLGVETVLSNCRAPGTIETFDRGCVPVGPAVSNPS